MNSTDNYFIDNVRRKDGVDEIDVRVGTVAESKNFGEGRFEMLKFIVENEKLLRIQCIAMEDQIARIKPFVKKNAIISIKGATSKRENNPKFNAASVPFVLMIYANTTITMIKDFEPEDESEENSNYGFPNNEQTTSTLSNLVMHYELEEIATIIKENTAAMKELTAALKSHRRNL